MHRWKAALLTIARIYSRFISNEGATASREQPGQGRRRETLVSLWVCASLLSCVR